MKATMLLSLAILVPPDTAGTAATLSNPITYYGMCDASAAVSVGTNFFLVANDEDNVLRVYRREPGGLPAFTFDMTAFLRIGRKSPETDIEASATLGDRIYWITSHGQNAKGKNAPNRERFFATTCTVQGDIVKLTPVGRPYASLLVDLARAPQLAQFRLATAAKRAPKSPGALNIEGLTATPEGHLLIGFRNPIPGGKALLVPLLNPGELIEGRFAKLGDPLLLDLGGLGIRSMGYDGGKFLIIAGPFGNEGESRAYEWDGKSTTPRLLPDLRFPGSNPEGLAFSRPEGKPEFFVLSDDGTLKIDGVDCKKVKDPNRRHFRGYSLSLELRPVPTDAGRPNPP
jgi:hypothetical protein